MKIDTQMNRDIIYNLPKGLRENNHGHVRLFLLMNFDFKHYFKHLFASLLAGYGILASAHSSVLDWNNVTWSPNGALTQSYTNVGGSGVDMTITFTGNTGQLGSSTPRIVNSVTGGFPGTVDTLAALADFSNTSQSISVSVTFSDFVENVNFLLFDIDALPTGGGSFAWQDELTNFAGTGYGGSSVTATLGSSSANTVVGGSIIGLQSVGNSSPNGNGSVAFNGPLNSFSFDYQPGPNSQANPIQQFIVLHDIVFTVVPEAETWLAMFALLGFALTAHLFRVRRRNASS